MSWTRPMGSHIDREIDSRSERLMSQPTRRPRSIPPFALRRFPSRYRGSCLVVYRRVSKSVAFRALLAPCGGVLPVRPTQWCIGFDANDALVAVPGSERPFVERRDVNPACASDRGCGRLGSLVSHLGAPLCDPGESASLTLVPTESTGWVSEGSIPHSPPPIPTP